MNVKNPAEKIKEMLKKREPYYKRCRLMIDTSNLTPEEIADKILESRLIGW